ncbi:MAG TPA: PhzF family phenazine biosynthesis protein [Acidimicrobiales bacterium]|jgi:trans-2,3-dihydro-3-hydroxyanthranilate isomerase|nr:PhzF family phenazine biosynthesis protein [Acidimicrobiales bacterium]
MTAYEYVVADVFTDTALSGSQLAVFVDGDAVPDELKQPLAQEIGFSETVYVGANDHIRIFTPSIELPFAGHPVLGTAFVLTRRRGTSAIELITGAGPLRLTFDDRGRGRMVQPLPSVEEWKGDPAALMAALGVERSLLPIEIYDNGVPHAYVVLPSVDDVRGLRANIGEIAEVMPHNGLSCVAGRGSAWKSRMFGPGLGVDEDPATGSAAGPLAVHLCRNGLVPWGEEITITQGVEIGRPSTLYAVARGSDDRLDAVEVAGDTVVVGRGTFEL